MSNDDDLGVPVALLIVAAVLGAIFIGVAIVLCCLFCVPRGHRCRQPCERCLPSSARTSPLPEGDELLDSALRRRRELLVEPYVITVDEPGSRPRLPKYQDWCEQCCYCPPPSPRPAAPPPPRSVVITIPPDDVHFTRILSDKTLLAFPERLVFECELNKPNVPVNWTRNGFPVDRRRTKPEIDGTVHRLILERCEPFDEGTYQCAVASKGDVKTSARLAVKSKPLLKIEKYLNKVTEIKAGQTVYFHVPFSGHPRPKFTANFDKTKPLPDSTRMTLSEVGKDQILIFTITDALRSDSGTYTITAENDSGRVVGELVLSVKDRPSVVRDFVANEVMPTACKMSWLLPSDDGGSPLEAYTVERKESSAKNAQWQAVGRFSPEITSANFLDLKPNSQYIFRIAAMNKYGRSDWATLGLTAKQGIDVPSKPSPPQANEASKNRCRVNWTPPLLDGGSPITKYVLEYAEAGSSIWKQVPRQPKSTLVPLTLPVNVLTEDKKYQFRVAAENKAGLGPFSDPSEPILAADSFNVPSKPDRPTVSDIFSSNCAIAWQPPALDGGAPITGYVLEQHEVGTTNRWMPLPKPATSTTLTSTIVNLTENSKYQFRVAAENKAGLGPFSDPTEPITAQNPWQPPGRPAPPRITNITNSRCRVNWVPPATDGGAPITHYVVEQTKAGLNEWETVSDWKTLSSTSLSSIVPLTMTVGNLEEDKPYQFRVAAENKAGVGPFSDPSMPIIAGDRTSLPGKPSIPTVDKVTATTANVNWLPPELDGGAPIVDYIVHAIPLDPDAQVREAPVSSPNKFNHIMRNLKPGETYEFRVSAVNREGKGEQSDPSRPVKMKKDTTPAPVPVPSPAAVEEEKAPVVEEPIPKKATPKKKAPPAKKKTKPKPKAVPPKPPQLEKKKEPPKKPPPPTKSEPPVIAIKPPSRQIKKEPPPKPPPPRREPRQEPLRATVPPLPLQKPKSTPPSSLPPTPRQVEQVNADICGCGPGQQSPPKQPAVGRKQAQATPRRTPAPGSSLSGPLQANKKVTFVEKGGRQTPTKRQRTAPHARDVSTPPKHPKTDRLDRLMDDRPEFNLYFGSLPVNALNRHDIARKVTQF